MIFRINLTQFFEILATELMFLYTPFCCLSQLCAVRSRLQKTAPMLLQLNEKAAAALKERDEHMCARHQAVREREQVRCNLFYLVSTLNSWFQVIFMIH